MIITVIWAGLNAVASFAIKIEKGFIPEDDLKKAICVVLLPLTLITHYIIPEAWSRRERVIDKLAIRFINVLDRMRGDYK